MPRPSCFKTFEPTISPLVASGMNTFSPQTIFKTFLVGNTTPLQVQVITVSLILGDAFCIFLQPGAMDGDNISAVAADFRCQSLNHHSQWVLICKSGIVRYGRLPPKEEGNEATQAKDQRTHNATHVPMESHQKRSNGVQQFCLRMILHVYPFRCADAINKKPHKSTNPKRRMPKQR